MTESIDFERVLNGIIKYLDREVYAGMNDWQKLLARMAVSRVIGNKDALKDMLMNNAFVKTFAIMDEDGKIDAEHILAELKAQLADMGKVEVDIPLFGKFKFTGSDVDKLRGMIIGDNGGNYEDN
jgi:hypothetical protein